LDDPIVNQFTYGKPHGGFLTLRAFMGHRLIANMVVYTAEAGKRQHLGKVRGRFMRRTYWCQAEDKRILRIWRLRRREIISRTP